MPIDYKDMDEDKGIYNISIRLEYSSFYYSDGLFMHIEYKELDNGKYLKKKFITDGVVYNPDNVETKEISWWSLPFSAKVAFWRYNRKKKKHNL